MGSCASHDAKAAPQAPSPGTWAAAKGAVKSAAKEPTPPASSGASPADTPPQLPAVEAAEEFPPVEDGEGGAAGLSALRAAAGAGPAPGVDALIASAAPAAEAEEERPPAGAGREEEPAAAAEVAAPAAGAGAEHAAPAGEVTGREAEPAPPTPALFEPEPGQPAAEPGAAGLSALRASAGAGPAPGVDALIASAAPGGGAAEEAGGASSAPASAGGDPVAPRNVAVTGRRVGERGRTLHVVTFEHDGRAMEAARYYTDFAVLRKSCTELRDVRVPFPKKTLGACAGRKLEERTRSLDAWVQAAVAAHWPCSGRWNQQQFATFLGVDAGFGHAEVLDPAASGVLDQSTTF